MRIENGFMNEQYVYFIKGNTLFKAKRSTSRKVRKKIAIQKSTVEKVAKKWR